ncbi:hypothetical protein SAMN06265346_103197 [Flavobacterium hercynium]|nr:hypothetical protein SAMN06265346_103197 [Flavobacterium hercynium]
MIYIIVSQKSNKKQLPRLREVLPAVDKVRMTFMIFSLKKTKKSTFDFFIFIFYYEKKHVRKN